MKKRLSLFARRRGEQGSVAPMVVILLVVLIGSGALVVDIGNLFRVKSELQNASDSAALAGAAKLDGTLAGISAAFDTAAEYVNKNNYNGYPITIESDDVVFGAWHPWDNTFEPLDVSSSTVGRITAMQVLAQRTDELNGPVDNMLAPILGHDTTEVRADAIGIGGGPAEVDCAFPLVVSECTLTQDPDTLGNCEYCMVFQNNTSDTGGWTGFDAGGGIDGVSLADLIVSACYDSGILQLNENNECDSGDCLGRDIDGESVQLGNGNIMNTGNNKCGPEDDMTQCNNPCPVIQDILTRRGTLPDDDAQSFIVTVPVTMSEGDDCSNPQYSGKSYIRGFATLEIFAARCGSSTLSRNVTVAVPPAGCTPSASGDYLGAVLKCDLETVTLAGGGNFGLHAVRTRLVE